MKGLPQEKKDHLKTLGYSDEQITSIDSLFVKKQADAESSGRESKETAPAEEGQSTENQGGVTETKTEVKEETVPVPFTAQDVAEAVGAVLQPILEKLSLYETALGVLAKELTAVKEHQGAVEQETIKATPAMSLKELMAQSVFGKVEAQIDGRSSLGKDKPKETQVESASVTGVPFLDRLIQANHTAVQQ